MADFGVKGLQLFFLSPSGERLGILSDENNSGKLLQFKVSVVKYGGVDTFSFNIARDNPLPLSINTEVFVYVDGILWFNGYINDIPEPDQYKPALTIKGVGFYKRFKSKIINRTYTNQTLSYIVNDILSNELTFEVGVNYNVSKISLPSISNISIEFKDSNLLSVMEDIMAIANYDYENTKYRYFVDNEKDVVIEEYGSSIERGLFEGYQYQEPEVSIDNTRIKNKILTYRTTAVDDQAMEYVATVEDTSAQDRDGIFESKLAVPSYVDSTSLTNMANFILNRYKRPQKIIEIDNLVVSEPLPFSLYALSNRRLKYWEIINDCDSLIGWDLTNLSNTVVSLSSTHLLTGRQAIKVECNNSENEYFEYTLDNRIPLPQKVRAYLYFDNAPIQVQIEYFDVTGNSTSILLGVSTLSLEVNTTVSTEEVLEGDSFGDEITFDIDLAVNTTINQWLVLTEEVGDETNVDNLQVNLTAGGSNLDLEVNLDETTVETVEVRSDVQAALLEIVRVRITILSGANATFYIDRLDTFADIYKRSDLLLESAEYSISKTRKTVKASFGDKVDNIVDEMKEQVKDGDIALAIFTKQ